MKQLLITGFDPFGGESVNPSWEAVRRLPRQVGDWQLTALQIPTVFGRAAQTVLQAAAEWEFDAILCVGQAGGRAAITPEAVAINRRDARIADNDGSRPVDVPVIESGSAAYFATVPVRDMERAMLAAGYPAALSYSAGTFVCNDVLYTLLHHYEGSGTKVGFIHVPFLPEQAGENQPSMPLEDIIAALTAAIAAMEKPAVC